MKIKFITSFFIFSLLSISLSLPGLATVQAGVQSFTGYLIVQEEGKYRTEKVEQVRFQIAGEEIRDLRLKLRAASGDLTFARFQTLARDGSNFTDWFQFEGRGLTGVGGQPVTYEYILAGAYAGISPPVVPGYAMYDAIKKVAEALGLPVPDRTFVIYGQNRSPIYEFFCYLDRPEKKEKD